MVRVFPLAALLLVSANAFAHGDLLIDLRDVRGRTVTDEVEITVRDGSVPMVRGRYVVRFAGRPVTLRLGDTLTDVVIVTLASNAYEPCTIAVRLHDGAVTRTTVTVAISPSRAEAKLPAFEQINKEARWAELSRVLRNSAIDANAWNNLPVPVRAGLLNIHAKLVRETVDGRPIIMFVQRITSLKPERIFAVTDPRLLDRVRSARDRFHGVSPLLHAVPPDWKTVEDDGSFKTNDDEGNLQITFGHDGEGRLVSDIDIDDHSGVRHVWDVVRHLVTRTETDPFDIHEILIRAQKLDPGYELIPRAAGGGPAVGTGRNRTETAHWREPELANRAAPHVISARLREERLCDPTLTESPLPGPHAFAHLQPNSADPDPGLQFWDRH